MGGLHHLVGTSPINPKTIPHAGYVTRKFSYASSYLLFISLMIFFSLPAITVAANVSYTSTPTQCGPFQVVQEDAIDSSVLRLLPLDDLPVNGNLWATVHDNQTRTYNTTINKLPLKTGTQFIVLVGALFSSPVAIYEIRVLT